MKPTSHTASQADGKTSLKVCGEVHIKLCRGSIQFQLQALVVEDLGCDLLVGMPFMKDNAIVLDIPGDYIVIAGKHKIPYSPITGNHHSKVHVYRSESYLLRAQHKQVLLPGDYIELPTPAGMFSDSVIAIEPRCDNPHLDWPLPSITSSVDGKIRLVNASDEPVSLLKHQHIAQVRYTCDPVDIAGSELIHQSKPTSTPSPKEQIAKISIDPDKQLRCSEINEFEALHERYANVFDSKIGKYNDSLGKVRAYINIGSVEPPPQKARIPTYNRENLEMLQDKMDELEENGVLVKPEDIDVKVEHVSPSFLVKKPSGGHRLVTAFNNIGNYAKPTPSKITTPDEILQFLAQWTYVIKSDMTSQFFQLPMSFESIKYLGTATPFKGIRVYTRAAMGMPGSTEHLDQLMYRILGDLIREGVVMKIADDLYVGGDDIQSLLYNWERILQQFELTNLRLSPTKTVICPITTTVLGWIWSAGTISVSPHKLNPLTTCHPPTTVKALRGWCGAAKHIKACLPQYSTLLADLDNATAGKQSRDKIVWTDKLKSAFENAQKALCDPKTITIPRRDDLLIITNDGAVRNGGMGSVLFIMRRGRMLLGGYFSAKLKHFQSNWLPCEQEALAIGSAINHWGHVILQSKHQTQILTDSRPCVQAYEKLSRGEFSVSARVSTFMSTLSRYNIKLQHISGSANMPADYLSRSPMECDERNCQVCKFVEENQNAAVYSVAISDVINGQQAMPFTNSTSWKATQQDCTSLRRAYAHLSQGTRPGKKATNIKDVKRYLRFATLNRDGLLVKKQTHPFMQTRELIIVPRHMLHGLLTALHLRFQHPSSTQLLKVFQRHFYALDVEKDVKTVTSHCAQCESLRQLPHEIMEFSSSMSPTSPGKSLACDVLCRTKQKVLVIRDTFSSFTTAKLIANEKADTLRDGILECTAEIKSSEGASIRVDGATSMQSLKDDKVLAKHGLHIDIGRLKNKNKNPVAEKAILELENELKKAYPDGRQLSTSSLAVVVATLNTRIRNRGLSAKEIITQRDNITGEQLNLNDIDLSTQQQHLRSLNHNASAHSKVPTGRLAVKLHVAPGDLVYIKGDGSKHIARDRYIVTAVGDEYVTVKKLVGSQFRAREYHLKTCEIYPVPCSFTPGRSCITNNANLSSDSEDSNEASASLMEQSSTDSEDSVHSMPPPVIDRAQLPAGNVHEPLPLPGEDSVSDDDASGIDDAAGNVMHRRPPREHIVELEHEDLDIPPQVPPAGAIPRRPLRRRHRPAWMLSGEWDTDDTS